MRRFGFFMLICAFGLLAPLAHAGGNSPVGLWMTASRNAIVQIAPCGADICGRIVGTVLGPNDPTPTDWTGAPQCGLTIFRTTPRDDGNGNITWNGSILDPRDGGQYDARITLNPDGTLALRGYIGLPIFGRSQDWTPYEGPLTQNCRLEPGVVADLNKSHSVTNSDGAS